MGEIQDNILGIIVIIYPWGPSPSWLGNIKNIVPTVLPLKRSLGSPCCYPLWWGSMSTARVSLRKYFIPGCVGRGLDLDLRIRPAPAASGNPGFGPLGIEFEKQGFRTAWLITGQKFP